MGVAGAVGPPAGLREAPTGETVRPVHLPLYMTPEDAVRALAAATSYARVAPQGQGEPLSRQGIDRAGAHALIEPILAQCPGGEHLTHDESQRLLATYGIDLWSRHCPQLTEDEAVDAAGRWAIPSS
jgi:acyl-CoA synthetase (NDP forming)